MLSPGPLTVTGLACERGGRALFSDVSFTVEPGCALQIEGPNGSGKSSLLRILAGLLAPAAGAVTGGGARGFLGHDAALKPGMTVSVELAHWARLDDAPQGAVDVAMMAMNLIALADVPCRHLSSGQRRRAGLARVVASGAPLWLLDEPMAGLDTASAALLATAMRGHRAAGGMIVAAVHGDIGLDAPPTLRLAEAAPLRLSLSKPHSARNSASTSSA